jgi:Tfp pilus assembly ATPase PilU
MNQCLNGLFAEGQITEEEALKHSGNIAEMKQMIRVTARELDTMPAAA